MDHSEHALIERVIARPVANATQAVWGFTNRTDIVTLAAGDRAAVPRRSRAQFDEPDHNHKGQVTATARF
jgi:hypothetical protein